MEFSQSAETNGEGKLSPSGKLVALSKSLQLKLYSTEEGLNLITKWTVLDEITNICWSPDSLLILCNQSKRGVIHVFNSAAHGWTAFINNGVLGISRSLFCADSRQVLIFDKHLTRLSIFSLVSGETSQIPFPKYSKNGFSFSSNNQMLVILLTENGNDVICTYSSWNWEKKSGFQAGFCVSDVFFLPDSSGIVAWSDNCEYNFAVYDLDGSIIKQIEGDQYSLGISRASFTRTGNYMAICDLTQKIKIFHHCSWELFYELSYKTAMDERNFVFLKESEGFDELEESYMLIGLDQPSETAFCVWNPSGKQLLTVLKSLPNVIWLWDASSCEATTVISMKKSITGLIWPDDHFYWICGGSIVYSITSDNQIQTFNTGLNNLRKLESYQQGFLFQNKTTAIYSRLIS